MWFYRMIMKIALTEHVNNDEILEKLTKKKITKKNVVTESSENSRVRN